MLIFLQEQVNYEEGIVFISPLGNILIADYIVCFSPAHYVIGILQQQPPQGSTDANPLTSCALTPQSFLYRLPPISHTNHLPIAVKFKMHSIAYPATSLQFIRL